MDGLLKKIGSLEAVAFRILRNYRRTKNDYHPYTLPQLIEKVINRRQTYCNTGFAPGYVWARFDDSEDYYDEFDVLFDRGRPSLWAEVKRRGRISCEAVRYNPLMEDEWFDSYEIFEVERPDDGNYGFVDWALRHGIWRGAHLLFESRYEAWAVHSLEADDFRSTFKLELIYAETPEPTPEDIENMIKRCNWYYDNPEARGPYPGEKPVDSGAWTG